MCPVERTRGVNRSSDFPPQHRNTASRSRLPQALLALSPARLAPSGIVWHCLASSPCPPATPNNLQASLPSRAVDAGGARIADPRPNSGRSIVSGRSFADVPTHLLRAELHRRQTDGQPTCGTKSGRGAYNTPLHVFALVLILALSTAACSFPIVVRRFPKIPIPHQFLFLARHFGTGVLIATAFVHLLPTAFESLTDPCLPYFWNKGYPATPGLIAMVSVFAVVGIEMFFASKGAGHSHSVDYESLKLDGHNAHARPGHRRSNSNSYGRYRSSATRTNGHVPDITLHDVTASSDNLMPSQSPSVPAASSRPYTAPKTRVADARGDDEDSDLDLDLEELGPADVDDSEDDSRLLSGPSSRKTAQHTSAHHHTETPEMTEAQHRKQLLQCLLLEAGILFHSVFIGMALSVATGTSFVVLLVAISFHQTFEGFALGSRISAIRFPAGSPKPWLMAVAYGTTTPIGQAIGLGIHNLYDPASQTGLLTVGFMNAISSGLLLFAGLVELLAEDFLSDESYIVLTGKRRLQACASVVGGAALMALVGAWA
ncbi:ZIP zinc transporter-domain-containing protein [Massariosphaeria phaeospora]|uniref:ZIP zinc transporter-domain-containing protein n=1 Tax=Massariosphaeria phaeospora TaxID=100035 RepID=A0A7C8MDI1_9PLEO|nr:ZIP zinc transporter-domain-containing protein [Massariosphaeria phaeospora]